MAVGSTQPLAEMSVMNFPGGKGWPARKAHNLAAIYERLHALLQGQLYVLLYITL
jgi:hypothetical protein